VALQYVEHLDQVWVLCAFNDSHDAMVAMVIRDASENVLHHAVHVHPTTESVFDKVSNELLKFSGDLPALEFRHLNLLLQELLSCSIIVVC
jgi:hypothetical protein